MNPQRPENRQEGDEEWALPWTIERKIDDNIGLLQEMKLIVRRYPSNSRMHSALTKIEKMQKELQNEIEKMEQVNERDREGRSQVIDKGIYMF